MPIPIPPPPPGKAEYMAKMLAAREKENSKRKNSKGEEAPPIAEKPRKMSKGDKAPPPIAEKPAELKLKAAIKEFYNEEKKFLFNMIFIRDIFEEQTKKETKDSKAQQIAQKLIAEYNRMIDASKTILVAGKLGEEFETRSNKERLEVLTETFNSKTLKLFETLEHYEKTIAAIPKVAMDLGKAHKERLKDDNYVTDEHLKKEKTPDLKYFINYAHERAEHYPFAIKEITELARANIKKYGDISEKLNSAVAASSIAKSTHEFSFGSSISSRSLSNSSIDSEKSRKSTEIDRERSPSSSPPISPKSRGSSGSGHF